MSDTGKSWRDGLDERLHFAAGVSRRSVLRGGALGIAGIAAAALIGCGSDDEDQPDATSSEPTQSGTSGSSQEPDYVTNARADGAPYAYNYEEPSTQPKLSVTPSSLPSETTTVLLEARGKVA